MVLIETLSHFILASKLQAIYKQSTSNLQAKHDIYGNHEQASTNSTKQQR